MAAYVRLLARTCRGSGGLTRSQAVLAFWHGANITGLAAALRWRGDLPHASFSTRGFRGVAITTLLESLGVLTLPLPEESDRAGARALAITLARLAADGYSIAITPDGPFGPPRQAKPGALLIARSAGLPVIAAAPGARPALRLPRWDRHIVPLPFSSLWVIEGETTQLTGRSRIGRDDVAELTRRLNVVADATEQRMAGRRRTAPP